MAVDDLGLEVLKKSGEQTVPGQKGDHYIKVGGSRTDPLPAIPTEDSTDGTTTHFTGSVGVGGTAIPAVAGTDITELLISTPSSTPGNRFLEISFDGGTIFYPVESGESLKWKPKGITQIDVRASAATVTFHVLMNRKEF